MTRDDFLDRLERITVSRRDRRFALYKPLLLLLLLGKARAHGPKRVAFNEIEAPLKALIE